MFPDSKFAVPRGSFTRPVAVPIGEPTASPSTTVTISCEWLPYIRGALQQLLLQATWDTGNPSVLALAQARASNLIDLFQECSGGGVPFSCPFDFSIPGAGDDGFTLLAEGGDFVPNDCGQYIDGLGWSNTEMYSPGNDCYFQSIDLHKVYGTSLTCDHVRMTYTLSKGLFTGCYPGDSNGLILYQAGSVIAYALVTSSGDPDGGGKVLEVTGGPFTFDEVRMVVRATQANTILSGGTCQITRFDFNKTGGGC